jgi:hypothetical protein
MKTKLKKVSNLAKGLMFFALVSCSMGYAQEKESAFTLGGNVDGYYKFDAGRTKSNSKTRFTERHNSFEIGMASFNVQHKANRLTTYIDLGVGNRVDQFSANSSNTEIFIKEAFMRYELADGLNVTLGSWRKHLGYEHINANENANYSMSYAFTNSPFFNTGVKLDYSIDNFNFMFGVTNATDFRSALDANSTFKNVIGQFGYTFEKTKIIYSFQTRGTVEFPRNVSQNDLIVEHQFDDQWTVALNIANAMINYEIRNSWNSAAGYVKFKHNDVINFNFRSEFFNSSKPQMYYFADYKNANIFSNTFSLNYKIANLTLIPELRFDYASRDLFVLNNKPTDLNIFFLVGATYQF